jgi:hypothetical protein
LIRVKHRRVGGSEGVNESRVVERTVQTAPIKAQSESRSPRYGEHLQRRVEPFGRDNGHVGLVHTFSIARRAIGTIVAHRNTMRRL